MKFHKEAYSIFHLAQKQKDCLECSSTRNYTLLLHRIFFHLLYSTAQVQVRLCSFSPHPKMTTYQSALVHRPVICIIGQPMQIPCMVSQCPMEFWKCNLKKLQASLTNLARSWLGPQALLTDTLHIEKEIAQCLENHFEITNYKVQQKDQRFQ